MPFYWNPIYWLFVGPALLLMLYAQWRVRTAYNKWGRVPNRTGLPGAKVAERLLIENGLSGIRIQGIGGQLTDNYDPRSKTLNLSQGTATQSSVAAMAIVAHEVGHAQQDATGSLLLRLRSGLVPAVNIGSQLGPILFLVGFFLQFTPLMWLGIAFFSMAFVFALVTLPVEIDASSRAMKMLRASGLVTGETERRGVRAVLTAAALTYVAALLMALSQLLYYVTLASGSRRRR
ncbi:MAG TPA: zinc metallopeptidase [Chloroflexi bacterium]|nr:zinc metallopeptidase [Chloroflexota bacterium]